MPSLPRSLVLRPLAVAFVLLLAVGCDKLPDGLSSEEAGLDTTKPSDTVETTEDSTPDATEVEPDTRPLPVVVTECMGTLPQGTAPGERVVVDLCGELDRPASTFVAAARRIESEVDFIFGPASQSQVGDYLLDTGVARFVVQGPDRHASPCPYGASIIDATYLGPDGLGAPTPDNVGEVCWFMQLGRTIRPDAGSFEILADGGDGGPAILAATSTDALADWVSLSGLARQYVGAAFDIYFDPESSLDLTVTNYFVARPGEPAITYLTAIRNDGTETRYVLGGDLIDSGGVVEFFNPMSSTHGFSYSSITPEPMELLAFASETSTHAYVPELEGFDESGRAVPRSSYVAISGVAAVVLDNTNPLGLLVSGQTARHGEGVAKLAPGEVHVWRRRFFVGSAALSSITDAVHAERGRTVGRVEGRVVDPAGIPVPGVPVVAIDLDEDQATTRFLSGADGRFSGGLPEGRYRLWPDPEARAVVTAPELEVQDDASARVEVVVGGSGLLHVSIRDGRDGGLIPGKVTVLCSGVCPRPNDTRLRDPNTGGYGGSAVAVRYVGVEGELDLALPPGDYQLVVSRGTTWTVWPPVAAGQRPTSAAAAVSVTADQTTTIDAVLWPAVDTSEYVSADFHVHAINSPDAPVANTDRALSFIGAGVDVLISTDHDFLTDYGPVVRALGAEGVIATMVGVELTTFDYGHYNAFPLEVDLLDIVGGAIDWAVDEGSPLHPRDLFAALERFAGDQVVQVNHADSGYIALTGIDVVNRRSTMPPETFRMPAYEDPVTGDTGLWVEEFTALEVYNGYSRSAFWTLMNWWFAMVANGFAPTVTASSDSHRLYTSLGGSPVTWVHVGAEHDTVPTFDAQVFARAANGNRAFGSNGPFVRFFATSTDGTRVDVGNTLASGGAGDEVTLHVQVSSPLWMPFDTVSLYGNVTDSSPPPGETNMEPPATLAVAQFELGEADQVTLPDQTTAAGFFKEVTFVVTPTSDSFYVVTVESTRGASMFPVLWGGVEPFAFTNALFVDVDGGGYDRPPGAVTRGGGTGGGRREIPRRVPTREDFEVLRRRLVEEHGF